MSQRVQTGESIRKRTGVAGVGDGDEVGRHLLRAQRPRLGGGRGAVRQVRVLEGLEARVADALLLETRRGVWWGQKCVGLNGL